MAHNDCHGALTLEIARRAAFVETAHVSSQGRRPVGFRAVFRLSGNDREHGEHDEDA